MSVPNGIDQLGDSTWMNVSVFVDPERDAGLDHLVDGGEYLIGTTIYEGATSNFVFAVDKQTGKTVWKRYGNIAGQTLCCSLGIVVFSDAGSLVALNVKTGKELWKLTNLGHALSGPPVIVDHSLYYNTKAREIMEVSLKTGKVLNKITTGKFFVGAICESNGVIAGVGNATADPIRNLYNYLWTYDTRSGKTGTLFLGEMLSAKNSNPLLVAEDYFLIWGDTESDRFGLTVVNGLADDTRWSYASKNFIQSVVVGDQNVYILSDSNEDESELLVLNKVTGDRVQQTTLKERNTRYTTLLLTPDELVVCGRMMLALKRQDLSEKWRKEGVDLAYFDAPIVDAKALYFPDSYGVVKYPIRK